MFVNNFWKFIVTIQFLIEQNIRLKISNKANASEITANLGKYVLTKILC